MTSKDTLACRKVIVAINLLIDMNYQQERYFSRGYLNSEGIKRINVIKRNVIGEYPQCVTYFKKLMRSKSYEDFLKLLKVLELLAQSHLLDVQNI